VGPTKEELEWGPPVGAIRGCVGQAVWSSSVYDLSLSLSLFAHFHDLFS